MEEIDRILHNLAKLANNALLAYAEKDGKKYERIMRIIELLEDELKHFKIKKK